MSHRPTYISTRALQERDEIEAAKAWTCQLLLLCREFVGHACVRALPQHNHMQCKMQQNRIRPAGRRRHALLSWGTVGGIEIKVGARSVQSTITSDMRGSNPSKDVHLHLHAIVLYSTRPATPPEQHTTRHQNNGDQHWRGSYLKWGVPMQYIHARARAASSTMAGQEKVFTRVGQE